MTIILSALALFVALVALWLGSAAVKKIEAGNAEIKKQIKVEVDKVKVELEKKVDTAANKLKTHEAKMGGITEGQSTVKETSESLQKEVVSLRKELNDPLFRLPPQYRDGAPAAPIKRDVG